LKEILRKIEVLCIIPLLGTVTIHEIMNDEIKLEVSKGKTLRKYLHVFQSRITWRSEISLTCLLHFLALSSMLTSIF